MVKRSSQGRFRICGDGYWVVDGSEWEMEKLLTVLRQGPRRTVVIRSGLDGRDGGRVPIEKEITLTYLCFS